MKSKNIAPWKWRSAARMSVVALLVQAMTPAFAAAEHKSAKTKTPIKHVMVIIGENRTFDHVFATYKPKKGETVDNLLSKGIINRTARPGRITPSPANSPQPIPVMMGFNSARQASRCFPIFRRRLREDQPRLSSRALWLQKRSRLDSQTITTNSSPPAERVSARVT